MTLARLAVDTGGWYNEGTNDITVGFARAQRDLACVYSVGFYDDDAQEDRLKNVSIRIDRPGLRAVHPTRYIFRSPAARRESLVRTAFISPDVFESGSVRAHVFPLRPASRKTWDGLLAVSFELPLTAEVHHEAVRDFGAVLTSGSAVVHRFNRRVTLRSDSETGLVAPSLTFLEPVTLKPGEYELTVVLTDPDDDQPYSTRIGVTLPRVPRTGVFLTGPLLGRPAGGHLVIRGGGHAGVGDGVGGARSFEPLLVYQLDGPTDLVALTQACRVAANRRHARAEGLDDELAVQRRLMTVSGEVVAGLKEQGLTLEGEGRVRCQNFLDVVPPVRPGDYAFRAHLPGAAQQPGGQAEVRFVVRDTTPQADGSR